jgi:hypothetical protein
LLSSEKYSDGMADLMDVLIREHWTEHLPEDLLSTVVRGPRRNLDRAVFGGRIDSIQSTTSFRSSDVIRTFSGLTQSDRYESATQESERNYFMAPRLSAPQTTLSRDSCRQESIAAILCAGKVRVSGIVQRYRRMGRVPPRAKRSPASGSRTLANAKWKGC